MTHSSILLYGSTRNILEARQLVLQTLGHQVLIATDLTELHRIVSSANHLDLLVLAQSLSKHECGRAIMLTHARWPRMRNCVLTGLDTNSTEELSDEVSAALRRPARLGKTLEQLVINESTTYSHLY
jgi:hypothetical protein